MGVGWIDEMESVSGGDGDGECGGIADWEAEGGGLIDG